MSINSNLIKRPSDRSLFLAAGIAFPLLVLIAYFKTYYFRPFFDVKPITSTIVHLHGIVMSLWVIYFSAQIALVRLKNVRLHMTLGLAGIALAVPVVVTGFAAAYNAHLVRPGAPPGIHPHAFFIVPFGDLVLFIIFFAGAIYYRKRPTEHKGLMLMTAINFLPPALGRVQLVPAQFKILWSWGIPDLLALVCLVWLTWKHRKLNKVVAAAVLLLIASQPFRFFASSSTIWMKFAGWMASLQ
jgi:hypothetical protein